MKYGQIVKKYQFSIYSTYSEGLQKVLKAFVVFRAFLRTLKGKNRPILKFT